MKNIVITILAILVLGMGGYLVYDKIIDKEEPVTQEEQNNITNPEENNQSIDENSYKIFSNKLKKELKKYKNNEKIHQYQYQYIQNDFVPAGYEVYLDSNGSLYVKYFDTTLNNKYGEYKIADNVLTFYIINVGQDVGNMLYFINENGTVGAADTEFNHDNTIEIYNDLGYKNIVAVVNGTFGDGGSGAHGPIYIDINGNIFSENLR